MKNKTKTQTQDATRPYHFMNIAHRGASGHAPENTILAFQKGIEMHSDSIELDLHMTKDGVLIVMHDEKVDRTTNGSGTIKDKTLAEIKKLDAGSWFNRAYPEKAQPAYTELHVPTFEEVIEVVGEQGRFYIETKAPEVYPGMEKELSRILEKHKLIPRSDSTSKVIIQSFSEASLQLMKQLIPELPLIQLISYPEHAVISTEQLTHIKRYAIGVGMNYKRIDENYVQQVRAQKLVIHPYTVNKREDMERLIGWGVTGMFTNYPDILESVLKNM